MILERLDVSPAAWPRRMEKGLWEAKGPLCAKKRARRSLLKAASSPFALVEVPSQQ